MEDNREKKFNPKDRPFSKDNNREKTGYNRPERDFSGSERPDRPRYERQDSAKPHSDFYNVKTKRVLRPRKKNMSPPVAEKPDDGTMRLNRYIANSGICSRREADEYIRAGLVSINGKVVSEMGVKVQPGDEVSFNNERISPEKKVYILLNKPKDFVTTLEDPNAKRTVMDLLKGACKERVYPVGRLDRMTTGVLLLTNDGELAKKLTHPKYEKKKIYHVVLDKNLRKNDMEMISEGLELEDGIVRVDAISYVRDTRNEVGIEIHTGRNRVIRRIFEKLNFRVKKLDRVFFAGLTKKGLTRGQWRFLSDREVSMLKMGAYE